MRVRHVLAYSSGTGAYGGPTSVAVNQCRGIASRKHAVVLLTGWDGREEAISGIGEYTTEAHLSRRFGASFAGVFSGRLLGRLFSQRSKYDLHHVHFSRDLTTFPAAIILALTHSPYVLQPHGMVTPDSRRIVKIIDRLITRYLLRRATGVLALSKSEASDLIALGSPQDNTHVVPNGIVVGSHEASTPLASSGDTQSEVVFVGRLHPRKRAIKLAETAALMRLEDQYGPPPQFVIVGPDEGALPSLRAYIDKHGLSDIVRVEGATSNRHAIERVSQARALIMPSENEPFGMVAIEALSVGVPIILDRSAGVLDFLEASDAILPIDCGDPRAIASAIRTLLSGPVMSEQAKESVRGSELDMKQVTNRLLAIYFEATSNSESVRS
jgi:glycosyltransferase involved in cell wall biosynthesis